MQAAFFDSKVKFTGTLVRRHYKPGQRFIQLVFSNDEATKLTLTSDVDMVRSLNVGEKYKVKGPEYVVGTKRCIYEPRKVSAIGRAFWAKKVWIVIGILMVIALAGGGVVAAKRMAANSQAPETEKTTRQSEVKGASTRKADPATELTTPAATTTDVPGTAASTGPTAPRTTRTAAPQSTTPAAQNSVTPVQEPAVSPVYETPASEMNQGGTTQTETPPDPEPPAPEEPPVPDPAETTP